MRTYIDGGCMHCGGALYYNEKNQLMCENCGQMVSLFTVNSKPGIAYGNLNWNPYEHLVIETQNLQLLQTDLGLTIDIPFSVLCKIETIEINGIKFVKENKYD